MTTLKIQVRKFKKDGELYAFYRDKNSRWGCVCFCFSEGHNECVNEWRVGDCKPVNEQTAREFLTKMQKHYDAKNYYGSIPEEKINLRLVTRL